MKALKIKEDHLETLDDGTIKLTVKYEAVVNVNGTKKTQIRELVRKFYGSTEEHVKAKAESFLKGR